MKLKEGSLASQKRMEEMGLWINSMMIDVVWTEAWSED